jgi:hypothetical protein
LTWKGKKIVVSKELIEEWKFFGLLNTDFADMVLREEIDG